MILGKILDLILFIINSFVFIFSTLASLAKTNLVHSHKWEEEYKSASAINQSAITVVFNELLVPTVQQSKFTLEQEHVMMFWKYYRKQNTLELQLSELSDYPNRWFTESLPEKKIKMKLPQENQWR